MNPAPAAPLEPAAPSSHAVLVEAARYALLRRLAPSIRHHLVVNLQPISVVHEVLERRLRVAEPNLAAVHEGTTRIHGFARAALESTLNMVGWLSPSPAARCPVGEGIEECAHLIASSLSFRGYALRNDAEGVAGSAREVGQSAVRYALTATLIHLTDVQPAPAELHIALQAQEAGAQVRVTVTPTESETPNPTELPYRALSWQDLQALAEAEGVQLAREADAGVRMLLPWASAD